MNHPRTPFALCLLGLFALAGCTAPRGGSGAVSSASTGPAAAAATRLTLVGVDRSRSTENIRSQLLTTTFNIGTSFDPARDTMILYRFGSNCEEVYSGVPDDDDAFALILAKYVKQSDPVGGTNYPRVLELLAEAAANATEREIRILIVGDGVNDFSGDPKFARRYRYAARRLSQNPRIKLVRFWGVDVGAREEIRSVFKPLGPKLQVLSLDQNPLAP
jgi:hypothetical protein